MPKFSLFEASLQIVTGIVTISRLPATRCRAIHMLNNCFNVEMQRMRVQSLLEKIDDQISEDEKPPEEPEFQIEGWDFKKRIIDDL